MAKLFGNLHLVLAIGLVLAIVVIVAFGASTGTGGYEVANDMMRWLHLFFGIVWIGLLYYLNFVQVPAMPRIPAELKKGVTGYIAPSVLFFFRWGAALTVLTGLGIAFHNGYGADALTFRGEGTMDLILGMWLALIMAFNVWFVIWPNQQKALNIGNAYPDLSAEAKAAAARTAMLFSRTNTLLSIPMLVAMAGRQTMFG